MMKKQIKHKIPTNRDMLEFEFNMQNDKRIAFAKQFSYHLKDVPLENFDPNLKPTGFVNVHLPNFTSIRVPFHPLMDLVQFRNHLQNTLNSTINENLPSTSPSYLNCNDFYLVTSKGIIDESSTLDVSFVKKGTNILMISKGISTADILKQRDFWLRQREKRISSPSTPRTEKTPEQLAKIRRTLSKRSRFGSKYSFKWI